MTEFPEGRIDMDSIEAEARRLRAEALRDAVLAARHWLAAHLRLPVHRRA